MNEHSSRSHTIYRMLIKSFEEEGGGYRQAVLSFVDLAGSERARQTGSEGLRLKEGGHINKSLLSLATVISKLADGSPHVPYRDSKLTRILQNSLGGNARTAIICAINPAAAFVDESISTLKFASRARSIENKPMINEIVPTDELMRRYEKRIEVLEERLLKKRRSSVGKEREGALNELREALGLDICSVEEILAHAVQRINLKNAMQCDICERVSIQFTKIETNFEAIEEELMKSLRIRDELNSELHKTQSSLNDRLLDIDMLMQKSTTQQSEWRCKNEALQGEIDRLKEVIEQSDKTNFEVTELKSELQAVKQRLEGRNSDCKKLERECEELRRQLEKTKDQNETIAKQLELEQRRAETLVKQLEADEQVLKELTLTLSDQTTQLQLKESSLMQVRAQLALMTDEKNALTARFAESVKSHLEQRKESEGAARELESSKTVIADLENNLKASLRDLQSLEERLRSNQAMLDHRAKQMAQLENQSAQREANLLSQLKECEAELKRVLDKVDDVEKRAKEPSVVEMTLRVELERLRRELRQVQQQSDLKAALMKDEYEEMLNALRKQLPATSAKVDEPPEHEQCRVQ